MIHLIICEITVYKQEKKICQYHDLTEHTVLDLQINMSTYIPTHMPTNIDAESKYFSHLLDYGRQSHASEKSLVLIHVFLEINQTFVSFYAKYLT